MCCQVAYALKNISQIPFWRSVINGWIVALRIHSYVIFQHMSSRYKPTNNCKSFLRSDKPHVIQCVAVLRPFIHRWIATNRCLNDYLSWSEAKLSILEESYIEIQQKIKAFNGEAQKTMKFQCLQKRPWLDGRSLRLLGRRWRSRSELAAFMTRLFWLLRKEIAITLFIIRVVFLRSVNQYLITITFIMAHLAASTAAVNAVGAVGAVTAATTTTISAPDLGTRSAFI